LLTDATDTGAANIAVGAQNGSAVNIAVQAIKTDQRVMRDVERILTLSVHEWRYTLLAACIISAAALTVIVRPLLALAHARMP
jgi:hypothetical protein